MGAGKRSASIAGSRHRSSSRQTAGHRDVEGYPRSLEQHVEAAAQTRVTLTGIFVKRAHGGRMDARLTALLEPGRGLAGNADRGGRRQVTLLSEARWTEL